MPMMTAHQVAEVLNLSVNWVYRNKHSLGGFQASHRGAVRFSENLITDIKEGRYALPNAQREVARNAHDSGQGQNQGLSHKARGQKVGGRSKPGIVERGKLNDPFGLLD